MKKQKKKKKKNFPRPRVQCFKICRMIKGA